MRSKKIMTIALSTFCLMTLAQCGGKDAKSSKVSLTMIPENPVVINADFKYGPADDEIVIAAPWFLFGWSLKNGSDSTLFLATYKIKSSGTKNGSQVSGEYTLDPTASCEDADGDDAPLARNYLAIIPAGTIFRGLTPTDNDPVIESCDPTAVSETFAERWFVPGLPEVDGFSYFVEVEGMGFFVNDSGDAIERLVTSASMFTQ